MALKKEKNITPIMYKQWCKGHQEASWWYGFLWTICKMKAISHLIYLLAHLLPYETKRENFFEQCDVHFRFLSFDVAFGHIHTNYWFHSCLCLYGRGSRFFHALVVECWGSIAMCMAMLVLHECCKRNTMNFHQAQRRTILPSSCTPYLDWMWCNFEKMINFEDLIYWSFLRTEL